MEGNKRQALYWADEAKHKTKQCKVIQLTGEQRHNKGALWQRDKGRHFKYTEEREETPGNETRPRWAESNWWNLLHVYSFFSPIKINRRQKLWTEKYEL